MRRYEVDTNFLENNSGHVFENTRHDPILFKSKACGTRYAFSDDFMNIHLTDRKEEYEQEKIL